MLKHPTFDFFFSYFHVLQKCAHVSDAGLGIFRLLFNPNPNPNHVSVKSRIFMLMRCTLIIEKLWSCPWGWRFTTRFRKSFQKCTGLPTYFPLIFNGIHYVFVKLNEPLWNGWNIKARKDLPKLYIPSTLNTNYLLWHPIGWLCSKINHGLLFTLSSFLGKKTP